MADPFRLPLTPSAHFRQALGAPENLGEALHLLANASDIWFWLGEVSSALGNHAEARR